jgi:hypothetical protein
MGKVEKAPRGAPKQGEDKNIERAGRGRLTGPGCRDKVKGPGKRPRLAGDEETQDPK